MKILILTQIVQNEIPSSGHYGTSTKESTREVAVNFDHVLFIGRDTTHPMDRIIIKFIGNTNEIVVNIGFYRLLDKLKKEFKCNIVE